MQAGFPHRIKYTAKNVTLDDLLDSLAAQKALVSAALEILEQLDPNFITDEAVIRVQSIQASSLLFDLLVEIYAQYQDNIEQRVVGAIESLFGVDVPEQLEPLITLLTIAAVYWVARFIYDTVRKKDLEPPKVESHITGEHNAIVNIIADRLELTPEVIERALEKALPEKKVRRLFGPVQKFFRPAKNNPGSEIEYPALADEFKTSDESVEEFPSDAQIASIVDVSMKPLENVQLEIRATDMDRKETGWAAKIVGNPKYKKRLPMDLYPTINSADLANERRVRADVIVEVKLSEDGTETARRIHLLSYRREEPDEATPDAASSL